MLVTDGEVRTTSFACEFLHIDAAVLVDRHKITYVSSMQTLDAVYGTC